MSSDSPLTLQLRFNSCNFVCTPSLSMEIYVSSVPDLYGLGKSCYLFEYKRANISKTDNMPCGGDSTKASSICHAGAVCQLVTRGNAVE